MRADYHPNGTVRYHFGDGGEPAPVALSKNKELFLSIRDFAGDLLDDDFLGDAVDLVCHYLATVPAGGYRLLGYVGSDRVTQGVWKGDRLEMEIEKIHHFLDFALVALQGMDFENVSVSGTLDMMRFYGEMKEALRRVADTLSAEGVRLEIGAGGRPIFRTGDGVAPSPTDAYGHTEIRIDHTLQALAEARQQG